MYFIVIFIIILFFISLQKALHRVPEVQFGKGSPDPYSANCLFQVEVEPLKTLLTAKIM